ncbi:MAG: dihydrofolate reductase [Candidatus Saccharibacteria bacterium]
MTYGLLVGQVIFAATINVADELYLTLVDGDFNCDQFFPEYNNFKLQDTDGPYSENGLNFSFKLYAK